MLIDVVVPVFAGLEETRRCIDSVIASREINGQPEFELVLIDDCSPDSSIKDYLAGLQGTKGVTILENAQNRGFVVTANQGMALHRDRDVLLLNSDTEVANDWLGRLRNCAYCETSVGTVTPFSNNATICSFPVFCANNSLPDGFSLPDLDAIFARVNAGKLAELPTAVGFCMYIRRACINAVGMFDEQKFGRGYGEENDFCRRALKAGWRNLLCADTFVYHLGGTSFKEERETLVKQAEPWLVAAHPDYFRDVQAFIRRDPLATLRRYVAIELALLRRCVSNSAPNHLSSNRENDIVGRAQMPAGGVDVLGPSVQLHVIHDLGGGIERWCRDYCRVDTSRVNLILKPLCYMGSRVDGLMLYASIDAPEPIGLWVFTTPFEVTATTHPEYAEVLCRIVDTYQVGALLVSSLIGHTLDVLTTGLPTVFVAHDFFPACPSIHLYFDGVCLHCDNDRLIRCHESNHDFNPFAALSATQRLGVRHRFIEILNARGVTVALPSLSVWSHLLNVFPDLQFASVVCVPNGDDSPLSPIPVAEEVPPEKLRVVVLGMLSVNKGVRLLAEALDRLVEFADIHLVGAMELGEIFLDRPGVHVVSSYTLDGLQSILEGIRPHVGVLLSIWPETYSYTLTELSRMGVPTVATRIGAFAERIIDGETGYLVDPTAEALIACLRDLDANRELLIRIRRNLAELPRRRVGEMVADYHRLLPFSATGNCTATPKEVMPEGGIDVPGIRQAAALSAMRKQIKSLQLTVETKDRRIHDLKAGRRDAHQTLERERRRISDLEQQIGDRDRALSAMWSSTSWRWSAPVRLLGKGLRRLRGMLADKVEGGRLIECPTPSTVPDRDWRQLAFAEYRQAQAAHLPALIARISEMEEPPMVSVLLPTFNTSEPMLRDTLDSVLAQLYPHWELCIADDGSSLRHVSEILNDYAARDSRVRVSFSNENTGVSAASNRALAMATGSMVVLLDHDDILEPQALFRVAESLMAEGPDMIYSDEAIMAEDGRTVHWFVFRPAFSPEYLRSHPYIVHLVAFRRQLLIDIGGFDENLRISQDYDLILRASERAELIVHIPEILYRWRTHATSAGHRFIDQVMATSKGVLQRHLERTGTSGTVGDGSSFNFFDERYELDRAARVAIVIPSKNHGEMVRRCIETIEATAGAVAYDVIVVDHQSDDTVTLRYFDSIRDRARILRYEGPFNFSAINNWAVRQLSGDYSHYLFCNNDVEALVPGWLDRMVALGQQPGVAIVGAKLFYPGRALLQHAGVCVGAFTIAENLGRFMPVSAEGVDAGYLGVLIVNREVSAVTAACMLVKAAVFDEIHGFDEELAVLFGDVDLCLRAAARGHRVMYCHTAELIHHESVSRGRGRESEHVGDCALFIERWKSLLQRGDPYFNPNLSLDSATWDIARPLGFTLNVVRRLYRPGESGSQYLGDSGPAGRNYFSSDEAVIPDTPPDDS